MSTPKIKKIILFAIFVRLILWPLTYHGDVKVTYWWGKFAVDFNLRGYYDWLEFGGYGRPDQPMVMILYSKFIRHIYLICHQILWQINTSIQVFPSALMTWFHNYGNHYLFKLPMILADIFLIKFVYKYTKSKKIALILALYPPLIYNSAVWGSGDAIINLLGLLAIYTLYNKKYFLFVIFLLSSLLFKASLIIWLPIFLIVWLKNKPSLSQYIKVTITGLSYIFLVSAPFAPEKPLIWFFNTMTQKILPGAMHQLTSNAMNLWALFFGLKPRLDELLILNLSARIWSLILVSLFMIIISIKLYRHYNQKNILLALVVVSLLTFSFLTRMHERYTFPALIPLLILTLKNPKLKPHFWLLTITHMLNVYNWWWWPRINPLVDLLSQDFSIRAISLINVGLSLNLFFYYIKQRPTIGSSNSL